MTAPTTMGLNGDSYYAMLMIAQDFSLDAKDNLVDIFPDEVLPDGECIWEIGDWYAACLIQLFYPGEALGFIADMGVGE